MSCILELWNKQAFHTTIRNCIGNNTDTEINLYPIPILHIEEPENSSLGHPMHSSTFPMECHTIQTFSYIDQHPKKSFNLFLNQFLHHISPSPVRTVTKLRPFTPHLTKNTHRGDIPHVTSNEAIYHQGSNDPHLQWGRRGAKNLSKDIPCRLVTAAVYKDHGA